MIDETDGTEYEPANKPATAGERLRKTLERWRKVTAAMPRGQLSRLRCGITWACRPGFKTSSARWGTKAAELMLKPWEATVSGHQAENNEAGLMGSRC